MTGYYLEIGHDHLLGNNYTLIIFDDPPTLFNAVTSSMEGKYLNKFRRFTVWRYVDHTYI